MTTRILIAAVALALANAAGAAPTVSGDGACGIRAVDNESFLTCEGDRAPEPVVTEEAVYAPLPAALPVTAPTQDLASDDSGGAPFVTYDGHVAQR